MAFFGMFALAAGALLSMFVLRLLGQQWDGLLIFFGTMVCVNAVNGLFVYHFFKRPAEDSFVERALVIGMYVVGIGTGAYFHLT